MAKYVFYGIWTRRHPDKTPTVFFGLGDNGTFDLGATSYFKIRFIFMFYVWCLFVFSYDVNNRNEQ